MSEAIRLYKWVDDLGTNPASVDLETGIVYINRKTWSGYSKFQQKFILAHEEGHLNDPYGSETAADIYALRKLAGTEPRSLAKSVHALESIPNVGKDRVAKMYIEALKIDASLGNEEAKKELLKQNNMSKYRNFRRADGAEETPKTILQKGHKRNGFAVGEFYFSFTNILLAVIVILLINKGKRVVKGE